MSIIELHPKRKTKKTDKKEETQMKEAKQQTEVPSHEEVEKVAYELYLESGCENGHSDEHWFQAERLIIEGTIKKDKPADKPADKTDKEQKDKTKPDQYLDLETAVAKD